MHGWLADGLPCAVRVAGVADWRAVRAEALSGRAVAVRDAGFTEVAPGTVNCVARWPTGG